MVPTLKEYKSPAREKPPNLKNVPGRIDGLLFGGRVNSVLHMYVEPNVIRRPNNEL